MRLVQLCFCRVSSSGALYDKGGSGGAWIYSHSGGGDSTMNGDHLEEGDHQRMVTFKT